MRRPRVPYPRRPLRLHEDYPWPIILALQETRRRARRRALLRIGAGVLALAAVTLLWLALVGPVALWMAERIA